MSVRKIFDGFHPVVKLLFDLIMVIILAVIFFFLGLLILSAINGVSVVDLIKVSSDVNGDIGLIKQTQLVYSLALFFFPPLVISLFYQKNISGFFGFNRSAAWINYLNVIFLIVISLPIINYLAQFNSHLHLPSSMSMIEQTMREMEEKAKILTDRLLRVGTMRGLIVNILVIALIPAIGEEVFFRGLFQRHLIELFKNKHIAIFVTAFFFSAFHFQFLSFIPRLFLGIVLGYLYVWSGSIWLNITAHFTNNAIAVVAYYVMLQQGMSPESIDKFGTQSAGFFYTLISIFTFGLTLFFIYRNEKLKREKL
jgi:hypothetical protein